MSREGNRNHTPSLGSLGGYDWILRHELSEFLRSRRRRGSLGKRFGPPRRTHPGAQGQVNFHGLNRIVSEIVSCAMKRKMCGFSRYPGEPLLQVFIGLVETTKGLWLIIRCPPKKGMVNRSLAKMANIL